MFFYEKDVKANERTGHLMVVTAAHGPVQHQRPAFEVEIGALFEGTDVHGSPEMR